MNKIRSIVILSSDIYFDALRCQIVALGKSEVTTNLSPKQYIVLSHLVSHEGEVCPRVDLLDAGWDINANIKTEDWSLGNVVCSLRKFKPLDKQIVTARGTGYVFERKDADLMETQFYEKHPELINKYQEGGDFLQELKKIVARLEKVSNF